MDFIYLDLFQCDWIFISGVAILESDPGSDDVHLRVDCAAWGTLSTPVSSFEK